MCSDFFHCYTSFIFTYRTNIISFDWNCIVFPTNKNKEKMEIIVYYIIYIIMSWTDNIVQNRLGKRAITDMDV